MLTLLRDLVTNRLDVIAVVELSTYTEASVFPSVAMTDVIACSWPRVSWPMLKVLVFFLHVAPCGRPRRAESGSVARIHAGSIVSTAISRRAHLHYITWDLYMHLEEASQSLDFYGRIRN
jgi:hypothetical protein